MSDYRQKAIELMDKRDQTKKKDWPDKVNEALVYALLGHGDLLEGDEEIYTGMFVQLSSCVVDISASGLVIYGSERDIHVTKEDLIKIMKVMIGVK